VAPLDHPDLLASLVLRDNPQRLAVLDQTDHPEHQAHQANQALLDRRELMVNQAHLVTRERMQQAVARENQDLRDQQDLQAKRARMAMAAKKATVALLDATDHRERRDQTAKRASPANQAHPGQMVHPEKMRSIVRARLAVANRRQCRFETAIYQNQHSISLPSNS
jgi:hypothetical protein